jgi:hypothetical protein
MGLSCSSDEGDPVPAKKQSAATDKELRGKIKKLRSKLERADARAERWKTKAERLERTAAESEARVKKLTKRLDKASRTSGPRQPPAIERAPETAAATTDPTPVDSTPVDSSSAAAPDASWTVVQLRAEARSRGIAGLSGKSKAELLAALT